MGVSVIGRPNIRDCVYSSTNSKPNTLGGTEYERYMYLRNQNIVEAFTTASFWNAANNYSRFNPVRLNNNEMYEANVATTNTNPDNGINARALWTRVYFSSNVKCINTN
jgi:hypothetical protein